VLGFNGWTDYPEPLGAAPLRLGTTSFPRKVPLRNFFKCASLGLALLPFLGGRAFADPNLQLVDSHFDLQLAEAGGASQTGLSVDDLGFTSEDLQSELSQKDLNTREDMLKIHQILGVLTAVPMTTEYVLGFVTSGNVANGNTDTSLHATLGLATAALYATTASFEIFAPKPKHKKHTGNTAIHEALSWVHLPLMVLVPLTGDMIDDRLANHQPLGNLPNVHGAMATLLVASYLTSLTVMTF
jgi:hypothetical protein